ncbi:hypothetical protein [Flavobacterium pedocola]
MSRKVMSSESSQNSFDFYFAYSKNTWMDEAKFQKWVEKQDTARITLGYFRGDCCGSVPNPEKMYAKITNDTIYYDYRNTQIPDCDSSTGLCGAVIDFVINVKKHPDYRKYPWKKIISKN